MCNAAMTNDKPKQPNPENREKPSRYPELFTDAESERRAARMICHQIEDYIILGRSDAVDRQVEKDDGYHWNNVRYVLLVGEEDSSPYDEWLVERTGEPYWRIVVRSWPDKSPEASGIMSIHNPSQTRDFLRNDCMLEDQHFTTAPNLEGDV